MNHNYIEVHLRLTVLSLIWMLPCAVRATNEFPTVDNVRSSTVVVCSFSDSTGETCGSGFVISDDMLVCNYHVICPDNADLGRTPPSVSIKTPNGAILPTVQIVAVDKENDLAILRAGTKGLLGAPLGLGESTNIRVGERVIVVGSPLGLEGTMTDGIVSALRSLDGAGSLVQISAPISPGSSGSPVLDQQGNVIAVAKATLKEGQSLNFAIPIQHVQDILLFSRFPSLTNAKVPLIGCWKCLDETSFSGDQYPVDFETFMIIPSVDKLVNVRRYRNGILEVETESMHIDGNRLQYGVGTPDQNFCSWSVTNNSLIVKDYGGEKTLEYVRVD